MIYYIENDITGEYWNGETEQWQRELNVICAFEDYETALTFANKSDLTNYTIKLWE